MNISRKAADFFVTCVLSLLSANGKVWRKNVIKKLKYKKILLKLSGEALAGNKSSGIDSEIIGKICEQIKVIKGTTPTEAAKNAYAWCVEKGFIKNAKI